MSFSDNWGDQLIRLLLFWSIFLPLGGWLSVDNLLFKNSNKKFKKTISVASFALLTQVPIMYFFSTIFKLKSDIWLSGNAIYNVLCQEEYTTLIGQKLLLYPELLKFLTYATLGIEGICSLLLFCPIFTKALRIFLVILFVLFQLMLGLCMEVSIFPWASSIYKNRFWRRFMHQVLSSRFLSRELPKHLLTNYSEFLCHKWNSKHKGNEKLQALAIYLYSQTRNVDNSPSKPYVKRLSTHICKIEE